MLEIMRLNSNNMAFMAVPKLNYLSSLELGLEPNDIISNLKNGDCFWIESWITWFCCSSPVPKIKKTWYHTKYFLWHSDQSLVIWIGNGAIKQNSNLTDFGPTCYTRYVCLRSKDKRYWFYILKVNLQSTYKVKYLYVRFCPPGQTLYQVSS